jgi:hypothetical protein
MTTSSPPVPNFFIIGAPKCGTTSLARYLAQHPDVFMSPVKEPCFFAPEVLQFDPLRDPRDTGVVVEWDAYLDLFAGAQHEKAIGEASVAYLASPVAARAIRERIPDARLIAMLRDPADRLFSHYTAALASGATRGNFASWLSHELDVEATRQPRGGPVWAGRYAMHLKRYLEIFPREQIRMYLYEDYSRDASAVVADIFEFLGVDPSVRVDVSQRHNVTTVPRWPRLTRAVRPVMRAVRAVAPGAAGSARRWSRSPIRTVPTPEERALAIAQYADDVFELMPLIGQEPVLRWVTPDPPG